ncbi:MAG: MFS transporter [Streptosporangiaceae bacterium]|nr:MFS transporter [Streptosporangiaceae bacterium]
MAHHTQDDAAFAPGAVQAAGMARSGAGQHEESRRWLILAVVCLGQLMVVLDATVVNIALPTAQRDLAFSNADRQWVVTAYSLAFGGLLLLGGKLSDLVGRKRMLIIGMVGFAAASALGGAAQNFAMLLVARAIQGAFGAMLAPAALSTLTVTFTNPAERGKAFGVFGAIAGAGGAVGLLLGGVLTEYLSWRWTLYVNVAFSLVAVTAAIRLLQRDHPDTDTHLDPLGTFLVVAGLVSVVYGLSEADTKSWSAPLTISLLVAGGILLALFAVTERRVPHPLLPLRIVLDRFRGGAYLAVGLAAVGMFAIFLFLTYYLPVPDLLPRGDPALLAGRHRCGIPADDRCADLVVDLLQRAAHAAAWSAHSRYRRVDRRRGRAGDPRDGAEPDLGLRRRRPARAAGDGPRARPGVQRRDEHRYLRR